MDTFRVYARCRPLNQSQINYGANRKAVSIVDGSTICLNDGSTRQHMFQLDGVFSQGTNNIEIFNEAVVPIIDNVINGINSTVFAYGITGAGKSFTMFGKTNFDQSYNELCGVIPLTFNYLLKLCQSQTETRVRISYLQIYNEQVFDLLQQTQHNLQLSEDTLQGCVIVQDLRQVELHSIEEAHELICLGNSRRVIAQTKANQVSSRSHAIVIINLQRKVPGLDEIYSAKLSLVDLAGSEKQSVHSQTRGIRTFEGSNINRSLLTLGVCINILSQKKKPNSSNLNQQFIPYRDSKLTRLLKDSLGGNTKTVMIACISPSILCYQQTANTLKYACRANKIEKVVHQNIKETKNIQQYKKEINNLKKQNEILKMNLNMSLMMPGLSVGFVEQENKIKKVRVAEALSKLTKIIQQRVLALSNQNIESNMDHIQKLIRIEQELKNSILEEFEIKNPNNSTNKKPIIKKENELQNKAKAHKMKLNNVGKGLQNHFHQRKLTDSITHESTSQETKKANITKRISTLIPDQCKKQNLKPNYSQYKITLKQDHRLPINSQQQQEQKGKPIINLQNLRKKIMEDKKQLSNFKSQIQKGTLSLSQIKSKASKLLEMGQCSVLRLSQDQKDYLMKLVDASGYSRERFQSFSKKKIDSMNKNGPLLPNQFILNMIQQNGVEQSRNRHLKSLKRIISLGKVTYNPNPSYQQVHLQKNATYRHHYDIGQVQPIKMSSSVHFHEQFYGQQDFVDNMEHNECNYQQNGFNGYNQNLIKMYENGNGIFYDGNYIQTMNNSFQNIQQTFKQIENQVLDKNSSTIYDNLNIDEGQHQQNYSQSSAYENQEEIF